MLWDYVNSEEEEQKGSTQQISQTVKKRSTKARATGVTVVEIYVC